MNTVEIPDGIPQGGETVSLPIKGINPLNTLMAYVLRTP